MDKSALTETIAGRLEALGLPVQRGQGTDLSAHQEFLTAGWSSGNKTITYETAILLDEAHRTVYMHERTAEVGSGLSFGADSESSFQSGTTLMRKVRSVQYGPEGRAYEVDLDLGAIPKAVKESAREQGWDFTTVLRRSKALYGDRPQSAYTPEPAVAAAVPPPAEPVSNGAGRPPAPPLAPTPAAPPAPPADPSSARPGKGRLIAVVALGVVAALLLLLIGAGVVGWAVSIVVVVGVFLLLRILPAGAVGGVLTAVLCVAAAGVVFVAGALTAPPSTEVAAPADAGATGAATPAASAPGAGALRRAASSSCRAT